MVSSRIFAGKGLLRRVYNNTATKGGSPERISSGKDPMPAGW